MSFSTFILNWEISQFLTDHQFIFLNITFQIPFHYSPSSCTSASLLSCPHICFRHGSTFPLLATISSTLMDQVRVQSIMFLSSSPLPRYSSYSLNLYSLWSGKGGRHEISNSAVLTDRLLVAPLGSYFFQKLTRKIFVSDTRALLAELQKKANILT